MQHFSSLPPTKSYDYKTRVQISIGKFEEIPESCNDIRGPMTKLHNVLKYKDLLSAIRNAAGFCLSLRPDCVSPVQGGKKGIAKSLNENCKSNITKFRSTLYYRPHRRKKQTNLKNPKVFQKSQEIQNIPKDPKNLRKNHENPKNPLNNQQIPRTV